MVDIEFRDGRKSVPDHVAEYLVGVDTLLYTYEEAVRLAGRLRTEEYLNDIQRTVIAAHFKEMQAR